MQQQKRLLFSKSTISESPLTHALLVQTTGFVDSTFKYFTIYRGGFYVYIRQMF